MKIIGISDIHGILQYTKLETHCDVLVIAGDFSPLQLQERVSEKGGKNTMKEWIVDIFIPWLKELPAEHVIFVPGNHDFVTERPWFKEWINGELYKAECHDRIHYLCNETIKLYDTIFWGCPYSDLPGWAWYSGGDPKPYTPPEDVDVMIVHAAPDYMGLGETINRWGHLANYGSMYLTTAMEHTNHLPRLLLCGHIHGGQHLPKVFNQQYKTLESYGPNIKGVHNVQKTRECVMVNVSIKGEDYSEFYEPADIEYQTTPDGTSTSISVAHYQYESLKDIATYIVHRS